MFTRIKQDVKAVFERDPAAKSIWEVLFCYSGLHAIWLHRISHSLYKRGWIFPPRLLSNVGRFITGIEIHPGATIGEGLFIDHGTGVVIGETAELGHNVTLYQGVTLGGTGKEKGKRHPTIGDNVVIGSGARVLGSFKVGDNSKIGAGAVVVHAVPANSTVVGNPGRVVWHEGKKIASMSAPLASLAPSVAPVAAVTGEICDCVDLEHDDLPDPVETMMLCMQRNIIRLEQRVVQLEEELKKHDNQSI